MNEIKRVILIPYPEASNLVGPYTVVYAWNDTALTGYFDECIDLSAAFRTASKMARRHNVPLEIAS